MVVRETTVSFDGERVQVAGEVHNDGDGVATAVRLIVTLFDSQGQISGYAQQSLDEALLPGDNRPFVFDITAPGGEPVEARLLVNALQERLQE